MTQQNQRQYLQNAPTHIQDLLYEGKRKEAISQIMAHYKIGKIAAVRKLVIIDEELHEAFPDATFANDQHFGHGQQNASNLSGCVPMVAAIMFTLCGLPSLIMGIINTINASASNNWPTTHGTVIESSISVDHSSSSTSSGVSRTTTSYRANIKYEYTVDGTTFTSDRIAYGDYGGSESHAEEITEKYPKQKEVTVYYMPDDPEESLLENGIKFQTFILPVVGAIALAVGIFLMIGCIRSRRKHTAQQNTLNP